MLRWMCAQCARPITLIVRIGKVNSNQPIENGRISQSGRPTERICEAPMLTPRMANTQSVRTSQRQWTYMNL